MACLVFYGQLQRGEGEREREREREREETARGARGRERERERRQREEREGERERERESERERAASRNLEVVLSNKWLGTARPLLWDSLNLSGRRGWWPREDHKIVTMCLLGIFSPCSICSFAI